MEQEGKPDSQSLLANYRMNVHTFYGIVLALGMSSILSCKQQGHSVRLQDPKQLAYQLDSILSKDQEYRKNLFSLVETEGPKSAVVQQYLGRIRRIDSLNLIAVTAIIDTYGWLGPKEVGENGNSCLFLVIQHSTRETREKYLPLFRKAVLQGKALKSDLALLEDRVALEHGKKQLFGSQIVMDTITRAYHFAPIEDEPHVNERRKAMGLEPIENKAKEFGFDYSVPVQ